MSDEQLAVQRRHDDPRPGGAPNLRAAGIGDEVPEERRISPRAVIRRLTDGRISADVASALGAYFQRDTNPASRSDPSAGAGERRRPGDVARARGATALPRSFPGTHVGENGWRRLLGRQAEAGEDRKAAELAVEVHAWIADGMAGGIVHILPDADPHGLPALLVPGDDIVRQLVEGPLLWAASYADTLAAHPSWWRLTADFFGSTAPLSPEMVPHLAWKDREREGAVLVKRLRAGDERHVSVPILLRALLAGDAARRHQALWKLAGLGFPDALGEDEILALFRAFRGLDGEAPARTLDRLEWMAQEPGHIGGDTARLRLAAAYAAAVFHAFCGAPPSDLEDSPSRVAMLKAPPLPVAEAEALGRTLLGRAEALSQRQRIDFLDTVIRLLGASTASNPRLAWEHNAAKEGWERKVDGPLATLWGFVQSWAGPDRTTTRRVRARGSRSLAPDGRRRQRGAAPAHRRGARPRGRGQAFHRMAPLHERGDRG